MRRLKVLASADWLSINTSYAYIANMMLEEFNGFDWHYISLGKKEGEREDRNKGVARYTEYPSSGDNDHVASNLYQLAGRIKPDCIFMMEDAQWLEISLRQRTRWPRVCYFPWDNEEWIGSLETAIKLSEFPVVMSRNTRELAMDHGYDVPYIYPYIDDNAFKPITQDEADKYKMNVLGIPRNKKVLLYVGRMFARKNIEALYGMVQYLKRKRDDFVLLLHSDPTDRSRSSEPIIECITRDIMKFVRFSPNMAWHTGVPKEDLNKVYNIADVFVSAHSGEGFGMPACEAGLCEKPFVMTDYTTTKEFGGDGTHGFGIKPKTARGMLGVQRPIPDCEEFARQVDYLLDDEMEAFKMGVAFRKWVMDNCSREAVSLKWQEVFKQCVVKEVGIDYADMLKDARIGGGA